MLVSIGMKHWERIIVSIDISTRQGLLKLSETHGRAAMMHLYASLFSYHNRLHSDTRLLQGLDLYGLEMFSWDKETRRRNIMEEVSDARNYILSGIWEEKYGPYTEA